MLMWRERACPPWPPRMLSPVLESSSAAVSRRTESGASNELDGLPLPRRYAAVAAILGAIVLVVLAGAIANVALPSIAQQLQAAPAGAGRRSRRSRVLQGWS